MKEIMLVCSAGMSTSMLVEKMKKSAIARKIEVNIFALPMSEAEKVYTSQHVDVIMLGPQIKYMEKEFKDRIEKKALSIPVAVINMVDYGMMNGEKVLDTALKMIE